MKILFKDMIDTTKLQSMMDKFYKATKIPIGIIDIEGDILVATGWQDICTKFHRMNPLTSHRCHISDKYIENNLSDGKYVQYKCKNNMWDIGVPITVKDHQLATLFVGQFFYDDEKPDIEFFENQAKEFGFDVDAYLTALKNVRVFTREEIKNIMGFYIEFASFISELAYKNWQLKKDIKQLEGLLPICAWCKKIRDKKGQWDQVESYIDKHTENVKFSHGICPECLSKEKNNLE